jgi:lipid II:glycine glycyltransferase (peptidoglycan interpeptide bridge formation enzyme)
MLQNHPNWDEQQLAREASFLQSMHWGQFQNSIGNQPHYISGAGWSCLLLEKRTPLGRYLFAPYGPTIDKPSNAQEAFGKLRTYAKTNDADWLRLEPMVDKADGMRLKSALVAAGGVRALRNVEPSLTRILDLTLPIDELLASISQTTRNIIRRNQRENIIDFKTSSSPADIPVFDSMLKSVASRNRVGFFTEDYYAKQAQALMPIKMMLLELAYQNNKALGSAVIHDFGKTSSYTYAASLPEARDKNVSALLLWQAILNAKDRGMERLDLFGIAPDDASPSHPWYGFSSFKKKFGGQIVQHAGTWDLPITKKYILYRSAYRARSLLRH